MGTLLSACLPYDAVDVAAPPLPIPSRYTGGGEQAHRAATERAWWRDFADPGLSALEETLLAENLRLRAAWARLLQAEALSGQAGARRFPQASLSARASRQRQRFGAFPSQEFNNFALSVPVSYELDLFDRLGAEDAAATLDARATRDDAEALALTLSAEVAETWFQLLEAREREALLSYQLSVNETFLALVTLRFREGLAPAFEVHQQAAQVENAKAQHSLATAARVVTGHRLALLLGQPPGPNALPEAAGWALEAAETSDPLAASHETLRGDDTAGPVLRGLERPLPAPPPLGVPGDLLLARPDVRAARHRVAAADQRAGAAVASWFPSLQLQGSVGFNANVLTALFDEIIWSLVGQLTQALFDGGQRSAEIDRHHALVSERLDGFAETLLIAIHEVENALVQEQQQTQYLGHLEQQVKRLEASLARAQDRYREGLSDFLPVLTALTAEQNAELSLLAGRRQRIAYRIQLYRALGGSWTQTLTPTPLRDAIETENEARRDPRGRNAHRES